MNYVMDENYTVIKIKQRIYDQATQILLNEIQMSVKYANILWWMLLYYFIRVNTYTPL